MDKFSKISGSKVGEIKKLIKSPQEMQIEQIKFGIFNLIDECLTIRSYGSARKHILDDTVKIVGKEMFVEALIDYMDDKSLKEQIGLLESLKSSNKDWRSIDQKIGELNEDIKSIKNLKANGNRVKKIKMFLETYGDDERFETLMENYVSKLDSGQEAYHVHTIIQEMLKNTKFSVYPKQKLQQLSKQYLIRATQLGHNPNGNDINI
jgi:DNA-binding transcriptional MerR regulator